MWLVTDGRKLAYSTWENNTYISEMLNRNTTEKKTCVDG